MNGGERTVRTACELTRYPTLLLTTTLGAIQRRLGMPSELTAATVEMLHRTGTYSVEKARTVLGFEPLVSLDEGMARVEQWARSQGLIR